jgi:hypothetical protein
MKKVLTNGNQRVDWGCTLIRYLIIIPWFNIDSLFWIWSWLKENYILEQSFSTFFIRGTLYDKKIRIILNHLKIKMTICSILCITPLIRWQLIQYLAVPLTPLGGTLVYCGTPVRNHCSRKKEIELIDSTHGFPECVAKKGENWFLSRPFIRDKSLRHGIFILYKIRSKKRVKAKKT